MASKKNPDGTQTFGAGQFNGVNATVNPMDDQPNMLTDGLNVICADPVNGGEFMARPGFVLTAPPVGTFTASGPLVEVEVAGVPYWFTVMDSTLYRSPSGLNVPVWTDVTPVGITITLASFSEGAGLFSLLEFNQQLICTDSVNQPWIGTNLTSTPITGTKIQIDAAHDAWAAIGKPTVYVDSLFFICATTVANAVGGICIVWSEPNSPTTGYMQSGFSDFWNIIQTGTRPLFCIQGTNAGLYYSRQNSWGVATGTPSVNFSTTATNDTVSYDIGCVAAQSVQVFGSYIYFCDALGRPYRMAIGGIPEPIWLRARQYVDTALTTVPTGALPTIVQAFAFGVIDPTTNSYLCFPWASPPPAFAPNGYLPHPRVGFAFDGATGVFQGRWNVGGGLGAALTGGAQVTATSLTIALISTVGTFISGGQPLEGYGQFWALSVPSDNLWVDTGLTVNPILVQPSRLGYNAQVNLAPKAIRAITNTVDPVTCTTVSATASQSQGTATPPASADGTNLCQWKPVATQGRGFLLQFVPTATTGRWRFFRAEIDVEPSVVQVNDP